MPAAFPFFRPRLSVILGLPLLVSESSARRCRPFSSTKNFTRLPLLVNTADN